MTAQQIPDVWTGDRVVTAEGRGVVIGWRGLFRAIVSLDDGRQIEVDDPEPDRTDVRYRRTRARATWDNSHVGVSDTSRRISAATAAVLLTPGGGRRAASGSKTDA